MTIFEFQDYRSYIRHRQKLMPRKGWGYLSQMARHLRLNQVHVSQVLSGAKNFTFEQTLALADFLELGDSEREYLLWLVMEERAGSESLKAYAKQKRKRLGSDARNVDKNFTGDAQLSEEQKAVFYSHYLYSAVRLYTSVEKGKTLGQIAQRFRLPPARIIPVLEFLVSTGLVQAEKERFTTGPTFTVIGRDSPHLLKHLSNWRLQALQAAGSLEAEEMMIAFPVSLSRSDFALVQRQLMALLKEISGKVEKSPEEMVACLNIDWFEVR